MNEPDREALYEIATRLLCLEHAAGMPMSYIDKVLAEETIKRRRERIEADRRRLEAKHAAYRKACAEMERTGSREPMDRFVAELKRKYDDAG
jgi:hypothetical protein